MSDNVEDLVTAPDAVYAPPPLPFAVDDLFAELEATPPTLGLAARPLFLIDFARWTFVNHGAFGAAARAPFHVAQRWREHCEAQPLRHIDRELFPHVVHATRLVAQALRCAPTDVVFTPNATQALNVVVNSVPLSPGDAVFSLSVGYGSVKTMLKLRAAATGAAVVEAALHFPLLRGDEDVLALVASTLPANSKLAVFDAVTSNTALALPVAALCSLVRARCPGCLVLVDGAHALGAFPQLDVPSLGAHVFVSNCHKHLCSPRGAAVLWATPECHALLRPLVVSHGTGNGFTSNFIWDGCRDYSPVLALPHTLRWWRAVGAQRGADHMRATLAAGVAALLARWQTHTLAPLAMCSNMALVRLPADEAPGAARCSVPAATAPLSELLSRHPPADDGAATSAHAKAWQDWLYEQGVEVPIKCIQGLLYVRITAHVYNDAADYEALAAAVARALGWAAA